MHNEKSYGIIRISSRLEKWNLALEDNIALLVSENKELVGLPKRQLPY